MVDGFVGFEPLESQPVERGRRKRRGPEMHQCMGEGILAPGSFRKAWSPAGLLVVSSDSPGVLLVVSWCSGGPRGGAHHSRHGRRGALSLFGNLEF